MKTSFKCKMKVKAKTVKLEVDKFGKVEVESGIFPDTRHYAKNISAQGLYSVLLYGTKDGRIPGRNVLDFLTKFTEDNQKDFFEVYLRNLKDPKLAGIIIGKTINDKHKQLIYNFKSPANAFSTVKKKGFNDPLVDTGTLVRSIAYSINGKGRYGKG